ncbi:MAG: gliding motility-associated C-terminal domain-containing protein [Bacteroidetes bacterium]|nr:gliding motility-associated C-terminal domain-containing protein [Bacteroidota bacterium]
MNGALTVFPFGGTLPYTYLWNNSQTTQTVSSLAPGSYTVTITDANLCTRQRTSTITNTAGPQIAIDSVINVKCFGGLTGKIYISVSGGTNPISYLWSNGALTQDIINVASGTYTVTVTDAGLCTSTTSSIITQPLTALNDSVQVINASCGIANGAATIFPFGGTPPFSLLWNTGLTTPTISSLAVGSYTVTITDANLCTRQRVATVIAAGAPLAVIDSVKNVKCNGELTGGIFISVTGGQLPYTYSWSNSAITQDITNIAAGNYTVTITDANLCSVVADTIVSQPALIVVGNSITNTSCGQANGSITANPTGGIIPYTYLWSNGFTTQSISNLSAGSYTVTVTDANLCTKVQSSNVGTSSGPVAVVDSVRNVRCNGGATGAVFITVTNGTLPYSYLWSNGVTSQDLINVVLGTYTVTVTDFNNCTFTTSATITQPAVLNDSIQVSNATCGAATGSATVFPYGGTSPFQFVWSTGATTATILNLNSGSYTVTITDSLGCTKQSVAVVNSIGGPSLAIDSIVNVKCFGTATGAIYVAVSGGVSPLIYQWSNSASTQDLIGVIAGTYTLTVTDGNNCNSSISGIITQPAVLNDSVNVINAACGSANGAVTVFPFGGTAPYTYLWNNGALTQSISGLLAGTFTVTITDFVGCTKSQIVSVVASSALIVVTDSVTNVKCNGGNTGGIFITVSGGVFPYTYLWSNGAFIQDNINLSAGAYSLIVTDQLLCRDTTFYNVLEPVAILDSLNVNAANCGLPNGSAKIFPYNGVAPYTYLWSNGQTSQTVINVTAGSYTVTVTDANLCTHVQTAVVPQVPLHVITTDSISNVSCNGLDDGAIYISVTLGASPYNYLWSNSASTQDVQGLAPGNYTVTVTDNSNCIVTKSFLITEPLPLSDSTFVLNSTCGQSNGTATVFPIGGTLPYTYLWSTSSTAQTIFGLASGNYTVTVTDLNGCTLIDNIPVNDIGGPIITLDSIKNVACNGGSNGAIYISVSSGAGPYIYTWSNSIFIQDNTGLIAGAYTVTVTDQSNCQQTASYQVSQPAVLADSAVVVNAICGTSSGTITAYPFGGNAPFSYLWSTGATTQTVANLFSGTYTVTVTDFKQCTVTSQYSVIDVGFPLITVDTVIDVVCAGASTGAVFITPSSGTFPYSFLWSNGATTQDITSIPAGIYTITLTDVNGCTASSTNQVDEPDPIAAAFTILNANCNTSNGSISVVISGGVPGYNYLWNTGATATFISNLAAGVFTLTVTDQNSCQKIFNPSVSNISAPVITVVDSGHVSCNGLADGFITVSVTGGAQPYNYSWSNTSQTGNQLTNLVGNVTYTLTITDNLGCIAIRSILIINPPPITVSAVVPVRNTIYNLTCAGSNDGSINVNALGGTAPLTYQWSNLATSDSIGGLAAGIYTITITDLNGCSAVRSYTLTQPPLLIANAGPNNVICGINFDTLSATLPTFGTGYWLVVSGFGVFADSTQANTIVSNLAEGVNVFQWVVTDGICSAFSQVVISYNTQIEAIAGINREICTNSVLLTATEPQFGFGYWEVVTSSGEIADSTQSSTFVTGLNPGSNIFKWTVVNGTCIDSAKVLVFVKDPSDCFETLEMPTGFTPNEDGKNDVFFIKGIDDYPENTLVIYNRWGNKVFEKSGYKNDWKGLNDSGEQLPDGTYFVIFKVQSIGVILNNYVDLRR